MTFALAEALAGPGPLSIFLLNIAGGLALLLAFYAGGKHYGGTACGLWAALLWAVFSGDLYFQANQPNTEIFINVFQAWAFLLWVQAKPGALEPKCWAAMGALLALASFYKPFALLEGLFLFAASLAASPASQRRSIFSQAFTAFATAAAAWAGLTGYFLLQGRWGDFKGAVFTYNFYYDNFRQIASGNFWTKMSGDLLNPSLLFPLGLLLALSCAGAWLDKSSQTSGRAWALWAAYLITAELEVCATGLFYPHYYQLLMPPLVLGGVWGAWALGEKWGGTKGKFSWTVPAALLAVFVLYEAPSYGLSAQAWAEKKYVEAPSLEKAYQLAGQVNGLLKPGETFYEWGNEPEFYFASGRKPPTGVLNCAPLTGLNNPVAPGLTQRVLVDLQRAQPEVVILNTDCLSGSLTFHPVVEWARANYRLFPGKPLQAPYLLLLRKGGELEKRLAAKPGLS